MNLKKFLATLLSINDNIIRPIHQLKNVCSQVDRFNDNTMIKLTLQPTLNHTTTRRNTGRYKRAMIQCSVLEEIIIDTQVHPEIEPMHLIIDNPDSSVCYSLNIETTPTAIRRAKDKVLKYYAQLHVRNLSTTQNTYSQRSGLLIMNSTNGQDMLRNFDMLDDMDTLMSRIVIVEQPNLEITMAFDHESVIALNALCSQVSIPRPLSQSRVWSLSGSHRRVQNYRQLYRQAGFRRGPPLTNYCPNDARYCTLFKVAGTMLLFLPWVILFYLVEVSKVY